MHQTEQHGDVGVTPGGGYDVDVALLDVGESALIGLDQRATVVLLLHVRYKPCKKINPKYIYF